MLGDDALVLSQRLSWWTSRAPDLEEDIALANVALDLLGQARLLLSRAAGVAPELVPAVAQSPEDALAYFRGPAEFRNVRLVEGEDVDFADAVVRLLLFSVWRLAVFDRLTGSRDPVLAAVAAKGVKELTYHRDHAGRWVVTMARGTAESRRRLLAALDRLWPLCAELRSTHPVEARLAAAGIAVDPAAVAGEVDAVLDQVLTAAGVPRPDAAATPGGGRDGAHTAALTDLLAEMQEVARAHPEGTW
jgi:ring-1,2-phenylacetyl-CoA epoxidase subunit PaaC